MMIVNSCVRNSDPECLCNRSIHKPLQVAVGRVRLVDNVFCSELPVSIAVLGACSSLRLSHFRQQGGNVNMCTKKTL